ncbi:agamous-like MADS-box protein AGL61 [Chenopodium quinoa]|uniref:agamous-like MADS-box protein AGL61 n=1 Tax=Chenopodium quinoa TaxID=63459 RepID=UPI000B78EEEF|nr:agamous-like MADS-box protein AGL61 [Chenopodium quinoa]
MKKVLILVIIDILRIKQIWKQIILICPCVHNLPFFLYPHLELSFLHPSTSSLVINFFFFFFFLSSGDFLLFAMASQPTPPKKTRGRQKIKMERMEKDSNRQVTFSKRRCGLFKKASELCTLCGVDAAIIVFSPGKKAFSFGHPSVETVANHYYFSKFSPSSSSSNQDIKPPLGVGIHRSAGVCDLNLELTLINRQMEMEKKRNEEMTETMLDLPIEELSLEHLERFKASLEELKKHVIQQGNSFMMLEAAAKAPNQTPTPTPTPYPMPFMGVNYPVFDTKDGAFVGYRQDYY